MALADWQISYGGLVMGEGTSYDIEEIRGLDDLPDVDSADLDPVRDGQIPGTDYARGRTIVATIRPAGASAADYATLVAALRAATAISPDALPPLNVKRAGESERIVYCRPRRRSLPTTMTSSVSWHEQAVIEWHAADPNIYDAAVTSTVLV